MTSIGQHQAAPAGTGAFQNGATSGWSYADFDQSYDPINGLTYESTASSYTVVTGDTLTTIAQNLWGDASLWYLIAEANGLNGSETLAAGRVLTIPNKVHNIHHASDTWRPYNPNEAVGDLSPTAPKPKKKPPCGMFGMIILAAIAIAISIALPQLSPFFKTLGGKIIGAMIGSVVSQGVGVATGIQEKFSFKGVALAGLTAGIAGGLDKFGAFKALGVAGNGVFAQAAQGALSNAVTQGVAVATGLQKKFSFAGVAVAGVVAGVGQLVSSNLPGAATATKPASIENGFLSGMASAIAGAATRSLITGTNFGDNIIAALPDVIGSTLGRMAAEAMSGPTRVTGAERQELLEQAKAYAEQPIIVTGSRELARQQAKALELLTSNTSPASAAITPSALQNYDDDVGIVVTAPRGGSRGRLNSPAQSGNKPTGFVESPHTMDLTEFVSRANNLRDWRNQRNALRDFATYDQKQANGHLIGTLYNFSELVNKGVLPAEAGPEFLQVAQDKDGWSLLDAAAEIADRINREGAKAHELPKLLDAMGQEELAAISRGLLRSPGKWAIENGRSLIETLAGGPLGADSPFDRIAFSPFGGPTLEDAARLEAHLESFSLENIVKGIGTRIEQVRADLTSGDLVRLENGTEAVGVTGIDVVTIAVPATKAGFAMRARTLVPIEAAETIAPRVGSYSDLVGELKGTGIQANHLNQNAAFRSIIPQDEGLAVGMRGNAFTEVGSPHYEFHSSLEEFWTPYRKGGEMFGQVPTSAQYGTAVERALVQSGYSPSQAASIADQAAAQRLNYGLTPTTPVPRVPGRLPQVRR